jgi:hypothetical protein
MIKHRMVYCTPFVEWTCDLDRAQGSTLWTKAGRRQRPFCGDLWLDARGLCGGVTDAAHTPARQDLGKSTRCPDIRLSAMSAARVWRSASILSKTN